MRDFKTVGEHEIKIMQYGSKKIIGSLEHEIHCWLATPDQFLKSIKIDFSWLSLDEIKRYENFYFDMDRLTYLSARIFVRITLSKYAPHINPKQWRFKTGIMGRPIIDEPNNFKNICFNLSHTRGLLACAVTSRRLIGADIEKIRSFEDVVGLSNEFCSPLEIDGLMCLPTKMQHKRLIELWCLKEAYLKAIGIGLNNNLKEISFDIQEKGRVKMVKKLNEREYKNWSFSLHYPTASHVLALAGKYNTIRKVYFNSDSSKDLN